MKITRRKLLQGMAAASGASLLHLPRHSFGIQRRRLPSPETSGIEHIVVVMMENRSFDHAFGWLPNSDGMQAGLEYIDRDGVAHPTAPLAPDFRGCGREDPDHSYAGGREQYNQGKMDGFLRSGRNDDYTIGYYVEADRPFYNSLARQYTAMDNYFCSFLGPTFPNRLFLHTGATDRLTNTFSESTLTPIWERLQTAGISRGYYWNNLPVTGFWGARYMPISHSYADFLDDAARGALPAVTFIDPVFTLSDSGVGNDDHPHADIRRGDAFLSQTFRAVARSPNWESTVFIVTYDEWGGFFDHVAPPRVIAPNEVDPDLIGGRALLGFRVPVVVASPWTRGNFDNPRVNHLLFDHTSVLQFIEWRFNLKPLGARDASDEIGNLAMALDFDRPQVEVPDLPEVIDPGAETCRTGVQGPNDWEQFRDSPLMDSWKLK